MNENENVSFFDTIGLHPTEKIEQRCTSSFLQNKLNEAFPSEELKIISCVFNKTGKYHNTSRGALMLLFASNRITGLPPYYEILISHKTGRHQETITIWTPLVWNDRFAGCVGGGTSTGGAFYITRPNNFERSMTLPKAIINGFTAATTDASCLKNEWIFDSNGKIDYELLENWAHKSTHIMTLVGKFVAETVHQRPVRFSYLHGGSGGGRQSIVEAQFYPTDYDGIWASCPAIHWNKLLLSGLWPIAVMNTYHHLLHPKKYRFFMEYAQNLVGGKKAYYHEEKFVVLDAKVCVGQKTNKGIITDLDALVMNEIWGGPKDKQGNRLWFYFHPGVQNYNRIIPIGSFYYTLFNKPKPFFLSTFYARWVTENPKQRFDHVTKEEFVGLFRRAQSKYAHIEADNPDLKMFFEHRGKLMIDHGYDDPIIPIDGTIDFVKKVHSSIKSTPYSDSFRVFLTPGDGHGSCTHHGAGITEVDGMRTLMQWVENQQVPNFIRKVLGTRKGEIIEEGMQKAYRFDE